MLFLQLVVELRDEKFHQQIDIVATLPERGQMNRHHVEPIKQIFAETAALDLRFEILVRRRNDAHIDLDARHAADAFEFLLLQHPQKLDLHLKRHLGHFVQKKRSLVGSSKRPGFEETAPVNAPFSCPKNSLSIRVDGIAAQLILIKGFSARSDPR